MRTRSVSVLGTLCSFCLFGSSVIAWSQVELPAPFPRPATSGDLGAHCKFDLHLAYLGTANRQEATFEIAVADFDGDGHLDLAVPSVLAGIISIYHGLGDGKFAAPVTYSAGYVNSIVAGDFNDDGKPDLAVAIPGFASGSGVRIFLNDGHGGFLPSILINAGSDPMQVVAADFNRDGKLDLTVTEFDTGNNLVLLGDGEGGFSAPLASSTGGGYVVVGDFNSDGLPDLAEADTQLKILIGNGTGQFTVAHTYSFGFGNPTHLATADFDHNGSLDLAVGVINSDPQVYIYLGDGTGAFVSAPGIALTDAQGIAALDIDGDGDIDIATADYSQETISVAKGNGRGLFNRMKTFVFPRNPQTFPINITSGDFNEDGLPDLVTSDYRAGGATVALTRCPR